MAVTLTINNTPFEYPEPGDQAPWGEAATDWAVEVTRVLNSLSGPSDILETTAGTDITSWNIYYVCLWRQLSPDGLVEAIYQKVY